MASSVNDVRVTILGETGKLTITDDLLSVQVADGVTMLPQGTLQLPLQHRYSDLGVSTRAPYHDFIRPGDIATIEMRSWQPGQDGRWRTVLHGPVRSVKDTESIANAYQVGTTVEVGSMADILSEDQTSWWMYAGTALSVNFRSILDTQVLNSRPYLAIFEFLSKMIKLPGRFENPVTTDHVIHLGFDGLEANAVLEMHFQMIEGSHLDVVRPYIDAPFQELYALTLRPDEVPGVQKHIGDLSPGEDGGLTTIIMRRAPYPYGDKDGNVVMDDWNALPLVTLDDYMTPVNGRGSNYTKAAERNFFLTFPAYQFLDEVNAIGSGVVLINTASLKRFGWRPLKARTNLAVNATRDKQGDFDNLPDLMRSLSWRVGVQWNQMYRYENGSVQLPLNLDIMPGTRLRAPSPWQGARLYEYHVASRQLSWSAEGPATTQLTLERGLPTEIYQSNPDYFARGLVVFDADFVASLSAMFREQDEPGK